MAGRGPASFCLDPETPVLTADLEWLPIKKLAAGDRVVGFDEHPERKGAQRKMREAEVLRVWRTRKRALKLIFDDGSHVVCSPDHQWLFKDFGKGGGYLWRAAEKLSVGSRIRHLVDPWEGDRSWESGVRKDAFKTIVAVEELPEQELVDIETTTHTFIANGLFSHNCQGYDEMAHVVASGANRSAEDVYGAATPALDQFGKDAFIIAPSSPWQKAGQFYENYVQGLEVDAETGDPVYPERLILQLTSWDIYKDWEIAHEIDLFPEGFQGDLGEYADRPLPRLRPLKGAIQTYDLAMQRLEKANPETFAVERRARWATVMDAYLNEAKVEQIFKPWLERPEEYGRPMLEMQESGLLIYTYKAHADPSKSNCNFGLAIGHAERDANGVLHCVFDRLHHWEPSSWEDGIVDYDEIGDYMVDEVAHKFYPDEITFDQFNSVATIQKINKRLLNEEGPKKVIAYERTATKELNWSRAEVFKTAINMGLVHAPYYEQAENELKFLIDKGNKTVDCPDTGPVQTKDVADCMFEVVYYFLGKQVQEMLAALGAERIRGGMQGGTLGIQKTPQTHQASPNDLFSDFGVGRRMAVQQMGGLNRGYRRRY